MIPIPDLTVFVARVWSTDEPQFLLKIGGCQSGEEAWQYTPNGFPKRRAPATIPSVGHWFSVHGENFRVNRISVSKYWDTLSCGPVIPLLIEASKV